MYGRVIFELLEVCDCVHVLHQFDRRPHRLTVSNVPFQAPDQGRLFIFESAMSAW